MKLFILDKENKLIQYKEEIFKKENYEENLENLLENNPEYFFDQDNVLIIGRQVVTNLNTFIDLLGVDKYGNTVIIELKRGKTPRETIAQILEYASFVENLDYTGLNEIFQNYLNEENELENYHKEYFSNEIDSANISWNKSSKLIIIAQEISKEIKQSALYLRKKGIDIYCLEFKFFSDGKGNKIISSDFVIGEEYFIKQKSKSNTQLNKTNKEIFFNALDENGRKVFSKLFDYIEKENLLIRWGSKGFSLNVPNGSEYIGIIFGYPLNCPYGQSIITGFEQIRKKLIDSEEIVKRFQDDIKYLNLFNIPVGYLGNDELKWKIGKIEDEKIDKLIEILSKIVKMIREKLEVA